MWVSALSYIMEIFTKSGKPQNQHWDFFSLKNLMLSVLLLRSIVHSCFDFTTFQQVPLLQIKEFHITQIHKNIILKRRTSAMLGLALFQTRGALGGCALSLSKRMLSLEWRIICTRLSWRAKYTDLAGWWPRSSFRVDPWQTLQPIPYVFHAFLFERPHEVHMLWGGV